MQRKFGIVIDANGAIRVLDQVDQGFKNVDKSSGRVSQNMGKVDRSFSTTERQLSSLTAKLAGFTSIAGAAVFAGLTTGAINAGKEFQRLNRLLSQSDLSFVRQESDRLGLSLLTSADGFAKLSAAAAGTSLEGAKARDIFTGLNTAVAGLGLSSEQANGALRAFEQIISKGTVQAEELRGQLGERIPGAFQVAARAMGLTTAELNKQLELGQVISEDFLPKFAAELERIYSGKALTGAKELTAEQNRFNNAILEFKAEIADSGVIDSVTESFVGLTDALSSPEALSAAETLGESISFVIDNIDSLSKIAGGLALARILGPQLAAVTAGFTAATGSVSRFGLGLVTLNARAAATELTIKGLRASMALLGGPAGLVVLGGLAFYEMANAATDAEKALKRISERSITTASALDTTKASTTALKAEMLELAIVDEKTFLSNLARDSELAQVEIENARQKIKEYQAAIDAAGNSEFGIVNPAYVQGIKDYEQVIAEAEIQIRKYAVQTETANTRIGDLNTELQRTIISVGASGESADQAADQLGAYGENVAKIIEAEEKRKQKIAEINAALQGEYAGNAALQKELEKLIGTREKELSFVEQSLQKRTDLVGKIKEVEKALQGENKGNKDLEATLRKLQKELEELNDEHKTAAQRIDEVVKEFKQEKITSKELESELKKLGLTSREVSDIQEDLGVNVKKAQKSFSDLTYSLEEQIKVQRIALTDGETAARTYELIRDKAREAGLSVEEYAEANPKATETLAALIQESENLEKFNSRIKDIGTGLADLIVEGGSTKDFFKDLWKQMVKDLLASGFIQLLRSMFDGQQGLDFSGFNPSAAFGSPNGRVPNSGGGSNPSGGSVETIANALGLDSAQAQSLAQGAGGVVNIYGGVQNYRNGNEVGGAIQTASGAVDTYNAYQGLTGGAQLGGYVTGGLGVAGGAYGLYTSLENGDYMSAAINAYQTYNSAQTLIGAYQAASAGLGQASAANLAQMGINPALTTTGSTGGGAAATSSAWGSAASAAGWVALAIAADQLLLDGAVGDAGFNVWDERKNDFDGGIEEIAKSQLSLRYPKLFLKSLFGGQGTDSLGREQLGEVFKSLESGRAQALQLTPDTTFLGGFNDETTFFDTGLESEQADRVAKMIQERLGFSDVREIADGILRLEDLGGSFEADSDNIIANVLASIAEVKIGFTDVERSIAKSMGDTFLDLDKGFDLLVANGMDSTKALTKSISDFYGKSEEEANAWIENSGFNAERLIEIFSAANGQVLDDVINTFGTAEGAVTDAFGAMTMAANDSAYSIMGGFENVASYAEAAAARAANSFTVQIGNAQAAAARAGEETNALLREQTAAIRETNNKLDTVATKQAQTEDFIQQQTAVAVGI